MSVYELSNRSGDRLTCLLCAHRCQLKEGQAGVCHVNVNEGGQLKNLAWGHPSSLNIDPIEKKPLYHFLPGTETLSLGTVGCNFQCPFCQNWSISQEKRIDARHRILPGQIVQAARENRTPSIAFTYNEPTVFYPYARDIGLLAKEQGIASVFVSNGFQTPECIEGMKDFVVAANIDLKSFDSHYYKKTLKGDLEVVKESLIHLRRVGIWVEITTLLIEGHNDSEQELHAMAAFISEHLGSDVPWHFSAFHPDYQMREHHHTHLETLQKAQNIAREYGIRYVYLGNVRQDNVTHCPSCDAALIRRNGMGLKSLILDHGRCPECQTAISGIWE